MCVEIFKLAKSVDIKDVIEEYLPLKKQGSHYLGICPFHNDSNLGSFKVTPSKGIFKCWACEIEGDSIDFVSKYCGISSREAAIKIAEDHRLITVSEAEMLKQGNASKLNLTVKPRNVIEKENKLAIKASAEHLNMVYQAFTEATGMQLSHRFRQVLLNERHLNETELKDYFIFPSASDKNFLRRFNSEMIKQFGSINDAEFTQKLIGVPGFFVRPTGEITFISSNKPCLGIVVRDRFKQISGIQLRVMGNIAPGEHRYRFMSSGFASGGEHSYGAYGCGCGYIEDVLYPQQRKWCGAIAVTEGRFKATTLAKLGFITVNMHSISNWKPAGEVTLELAEQYNARRFVLAYDQENNKATTQSAANLSEMLNSYPVDFAVWDEKYGKGIDDVVNAGFLEKISRISAEEFLNKAA